MHSVDQAQEYADEYGVRTSTLFKCGDFTDHIDTKRIEKPIKIVYAGRLYCNRWKSLVQIGEALKEINCETVKIVLDVYTQDKLTASQKKALSEDKFIYLKGSVSPTELKGIYREADIALHIESLDRRNKLLTRVSFSTKIIDLMNSTCAIMAICWSEHAGYKYLKANDSALCISSYNEILPTLQNLAENPEQIQLYADKAYNCGKRNHSREKIQDQIKSVFTEIINKSKSE